MTAYSSLVPRTEFPEETAACSSSGGLQRVRASQAEANDSVFLRQPKPPPARDGAGVPVPVPQSLLFPCSLYCSRQNYNQVTVHAAAPSEERT